MGEPSYLNKILKVRDVKDKRCGWGGAGELRSTLMVDQWWCSQTGLRNGVFFEQLGTWR